MSQVYILLVTGNIAFSLAMWLRLNKERKRNRILAREVAGGNLAGLRYPAVVVASAMFRPRRAVAATITLRHDKSRALD
jgi:hypothetical protein